MAGWLGMVRRLVVAGLFFGAFFSSGAMALSEVEKCARKADILMAREFPGSKIVREDFINTTQGSYYQEYTANYLVDGQKVTAEFYSPFVCDNLRLTATAN